MTQPAGKNFVPRSSSRFRARELARTLREAKRVGGERVEIDPATGRISVILSKPDEHVKDNEVEDWLSKHANKR